MTDLLLLATLLDGPKHGYALKKRAGLITGQRDLHNNIVYPLLKRFVREGWVGRRKAAGQRGQTRAVYSLTAAGKRALLGRLETFSEKDAASAEAFHLRVALFGILGKDARLRILRDRDLYLSAREARLETLQEKIRMSGWPSEVVRCLRANAGQERQWIRSLMRKAAHDSRAS